MLSTTVKNYCIAEKMFLNTKCLARLLWFIQIVLEKKKFMER